LLGGAEEKTEDPIRNKNNISNWYSGKLIRKRSLNVEPTKKKRVKRLLKNHLKGEDHKTQLSKGGGMGS